MYKIKSILVLCLIVCGNLFAQTDRDALMALYNATDGPNWTNNTNWGSAQPLNTWFGVTTDALGNVVTLNLSNPGFVGNNLNGTLPDELGDLPFLTFLIITDNPNLTGPLPATIGNLNNLNFLSFRNNALNGPIPPVIGNLINLTNLTLGSNNLTGDIPNTIGNLSNLQSLNLDVNDLSGPIPDEIGNLINLLTLRINNNRLNGPIPASLANLVNLEDFLLYTNELSGEIPVFLGSLINLRSLIISSNQFTGQIPPELGNLINLEEFNVGINDLSGTVPEALGNLINVRTFNIDAANLSGTLPASLSQLTDLVDLRIGQNNFEGLLPRFTFDTSGTITPYFDMRFNNFHFGDFEADFPDYNNGTINYDYNIQDTVNEVETINACAGQSVTLSTTVRGTANVYEWLQNGVPIPNSNTPDLFLTDVQNGDTGNYTCRITSTIVTGLTLERNPIALSVGSAGTPLANPVDDIQACDPDADGFTDFQINLASIDEQVLGDQTGLPVSYFDEAGSPIALTNPYTNSTEGEQVITVRVGDASGCFDETTFRLVTIPGPTVIELPDVLECSYSLPPLDNDALYFTEPDGQGAMLIEGSEITSSQTIYIYAETRGDGIVCSNQSSFTVTVDPSSCENIDLTSLPTFFTPNNDGSNDLWDISSLAGSDTQITIFNRYGQLLEQLDPNVVQGWDGRYQGTELPSSDYWYRYTDPETGRDVKGHFTLKR